MKKTIIATLMVPIFVNAQVTTKISYTLPQGASSGIVVYTSENDAPVMQGQAIEGPHEITLTTSAPTTGFIYVIASKQVLPLNLNGTNIDLTKRISIPEPDEEGSSPEEFSAILQKLLDITTEIKNREYIPDADKNSLAAKAKVKEYYRYLQNMVAFADSIVTKYPRDNASLFTVFRLAHWCAYSPEVYTIMNKIDASLLKSDFAKELTTKKEELQRDSMDVAGKKPGTGLQIVLNNSKLQGAGAHNKLLIYWDNFSQLDRELLDDISRMHILFGNKELQVDFIYSGAAKNWEAMVKQARLPDYANYLHCNRADQIGTNPVIASTDNTCLFAGIRGYYLYKKVSQL